MALRESDIISLAGQEGVPPELVLAIYQQESSSGKNTDSGGQSVGGFQVSPTTFKEMYPGGDINNERDNAIAGIRYLKQGLAATGGDIAQTAAYYHAGPDYIAKLTKNPKLADALGKTTLSYMNDVVSKTSAFQQYLEGYRQDPLQALSFTTYDPLAGKAVAGSDRFLPTKPDPMAVIDDMYNQMQTALKTSQKGFEDFSAYTDVYTQSITDLTNNISRNAEVKGEIDANVVRAKASAETEKASEAARILSQSGINSSDMMSMAADTLARMRGLKDRATELRSEIQAQQVDFLEDPIKWAENLFVLDPKIRRHNEAVFNYETEKKQLDGIVASTTAVNEAQNAKRATMNTEVAEGTATSLELGGKIKADEARLVALDHNWQKKKGELDKLDGQVRILNASAEALMRSKVLEDQIQGKETKRLADELSLKQLNLGLSNIGIQINSLEDYKRLPLEMKKVYEYLSTEGKFGPDFKGSMESVGLGNPIKMPPTTSSLLRFSAMLDSSAREELGKQQNLGLTVAEKRNAYNQTAEKIATAWMNNVYTQTDQVNNPYKAPVPQTMLTDPNIKQLKIGQLLQRTITENPGVPIDDKMVTELVRSSLTKGDTYTNIQEAANDLVLYYKSVVSFNNKAHNFYGMNLPVQDRYRFAPSGGKNIDFTNYTDVMKYIAKRAVSDITEAQPTFESIVP